MTSCRVWAPRAKRAELDIRGKRQPMTAGKEGWWFAEVSSAGANTEYGFALDGSGPLPDPQAQETFHYSKLDWSEPDKQRHADLLKWHRWLIQLRRQVADLSDGCLEGVEVNFDETAKWCVVKRGAVVVVCNLNSIAQNISAQFRPGSEILLASDDLVRVTPDGVIQLPADSVAIVHTEVGR